MKILACFVMSCFLTIMMVITQTISRFICEYLVANTTYQPTMFFKTGLLVVLYTLPLFFILLG